MQEEQANRPQDSVSPDSPSLDNDVDVLGLGLAMGSGPLKGGPLISSPGHTGADCSSDRPGAQGKPGHLDLQGIIDLTIQESVLEDVAVTAVQDRNDVDDKFPVEAVSEGKELGLDDRDHVGESSKVDIDQSDGWNDKTAQSSYQCDEENGNSNGLDERRDEFDKEYDGWSDDVNCKEEHTDDRNESDGWGSAAKVTTKNGRFRNQNNQYPSRPDAEDCAYYVRTGTCKFGSNCKFNHPVRRKSQAAKEKVKQREEGQEVSAQTECKYYLTSGGCKYGNACRYKHGKERTAVTPILEFNFLGLPIRVGEKECPYYMRTGSCKYGSNCRFNHPDPVAVGGNDATGYANSVSESSLPSWSSPLALNGTAPFVPVAFSQIQGVVAPTNSEWNNYQPSMYPTPERSFPTPPAFAMNNSAADTKFYPNPPQQIPGEEFPNRPGQPECSYFLKTGDCKFKSNCKFHHPKDRISKTNSCLLSEKGLPIRPDQNICSHYNRYGICKFGPSCKYNHPVTYDNSVPSAGI